MIMTSPPWFEASISMLVILPYRCRFPPNPNSAMIKDVSFAFILFQYPFPPRFSCFSDQRIGLFLFYRGSRLARELSEFF